MEHMDLPESSQFKNPAKINAGFRALETIPMELMWRGASRPLLLLDSTSRNIKKRIVKSFQGSQLALLIHSLDRQLTLSDTVSALIRSYTTNGCDAIIACGSPALLDVARLLNLAISQGRSTPHHKLVVSDHLEPLVAVISGSGQALHLTEAVTFEGDRFRAIDLMPTLMIFDDRLAIEAENHSTLCNALATLTLASETLAFGRAGHFGQVYARSALTAVVAHLPTVLRKPNMRPSKTSLFVAEFSAGLSAGTRGYHPSWVLADQMAAQTTLAKGMIAVLMLPSALTQAKALSCGRPDLLLKALGGDDDYNRVYHQNLDPWDATLDRLEKLLDDLRSIKPGCLPRNLPWPSFETDRLATLTTIAAGKLDQLRDVPDLGKILRNTALTQSAAAS
jgi:alcohol dehydrogenase class IV